MRSIPKSRVTDPVYKVEGLRTQGSVCPIASGSSEQDPHGYSNTGSCPEFISHPFNTVFPEGLYLSDPHTAA